MQNGYSFSIGTENSITAGSQRAELAAALFLIMCTVFIAEEEA